jgi:hypothetical protein
VLSSSLIVMVRSSDCYPSCTTMQQMQFCPRRMKTDIMLSASAMEEEPTFDLVNLNGAKFECGEFVLIPPYVPTQAR